MEILPVEVDVIPRRTYMFCFNIKDIGPIATHRKQWCVTSEYNTTLRSRDQFYSLYLLVQIISFFNRTTQ